MIDGLYLKHDLLKQIKMYMYIYSIIWYYQVNNGQPEKGEVVFLCFDESLEHCKRDDLSIMNNSIEYVFLSSLFCIHSK